MKLIPSSSHSKTHQFTSMKSVNFRMRLPTMFSVIVLFLMTGLTNSAHAQAVGIDFESMPIGTRLTTTTLWHPVATYVEEYIGEQDDHYVIQVSKLTEDGTLKKISKSGYDDQGRKVFSERKGKVNTYQPYSCEYITGPCEHAYKYYNSLTKKHVVNTTRYDNRLESDSLIVVVVQSAGDRFEVPHRLGPHNLRLSNEHQNALGQPSGFKFVKLQTP